MPQLQPALNVRAARHAEHSTPATQTSVQADMLAFRRALSETNLPINELTAARTGAVVRDLFFDWALIILAWYIAVTGPWWTIPLAVVVIGNRQRALGNLLHDASHYLISTNLKVNDAIGHWLIALPPLNSLHRYRRTHFEHHARLGNNKTDPDYYADKVFQQGGNGAFAIYCRMLLTPRYWLGDGFGDLIGGPLQTRLFILGWWAAAWLVLYVFSTLGQASAFLALWFAARLTVFHAITTFRELCDHTGMTPGGIFSYSRNVVGSRILNLFFHPHNNGYHLVHHLMPTIPYHRLAIAHRYFLDVACYKQSACHCNGYFAGSDPVVDCWVKRVSRHV